MFFHLGDVELGDRLIVSPLPFKCLSFNWREGRLYKLFWGEHGPSRLGPFHSQGTVYVHNNKGKEQKYYIFLDQEDIQVIALRNISIRISRKSTSWCPKCHPDFSSPIKESSRSPQGEGTQPRACSQSLILDGSIFVILPQTGWVIGSTQMPEITND